MQFLVFLPCFWQIVQLNVVKLSSRLVAHPRGGACVCGGCWIKSEAVVLNLDRQSVGQFGDECRRGEMGSESS